MTLDEAIKHCKEKAEELRLEAEQVRELGEYVSNLKQPYNEPVKACLKCAEEHEQLAEWLTELKELREEIALFKSGKASNERPKGEWIMNKTSARGRNYTCTHCNKVSRNKFAFCPNCGADMRKENDNENVKT